MSATREDLTTEEWAAIRALHRLARKWPETLWLFSASGSLHVMRCGPDGERMRDRSGYLDSNYSMDVIDIPNDGGEW